MYDLNDLFKNTPAFDVPPIIFNDSENEDEANSDRKERKKVGWDQFKELILNINNTNKALIYLKE